MFCRSGSGRECGFDAARRACHNLHSIFDPSIRSVIDPSTAVSVSSTILICSIKAANAALMLPGVRDTAYILTYPSMNLVVDHNLEIRVP